MSFTLREFKEENTAEILKLWNEIVKSGNAFPQEHPLTFDEGKDFFNCQTKTVCAFDSETNEMVGFYILHPNNVGRCSHIANASYGVAERRRGSGIGELLVKDCLIRAKDCGFKGLQFNAVVSTNISACKLYEKLGFVNMATVPNGFRNKNSEYLDTYIFFHKL